MKKEGRFDPEDDYPLGLPKVWTKVRNKKKKGPETEADADAAAEGEGEGEAEAEE